MSPSTTPTHFDVAATQRRMSIIKPALVEMQQEGFSRLAALAHFGLVHQSLCQRTSPANITPEIFSAASALMRAEESAPEQSVTFHGPTTSGFRREVLTGWNSFSPHLRSLMTACGIALKAGQTALDVMPELGAESPLRNFQDTQGRSQAYHSSGWYLSDKRLAIVTEFRLNASEDQYLLPAPTLDTLAKGQYEREHTQFIAAIVRHELWHVIDAMPTYFGLKRFREAPSFAQAYEADLQALGGIEAAQAKGYGYYARPEHVSIGKGEAFAELGAEASGGSQRGTRMAKDWPRAFAHMQTLRKDLEASLEAGPAAFMHFLSKIHEPSRTSPYAAKSVAQGYLELMRKDQSSTQGSIKDWAQATAPTVTVERINHILSTNPLPGDNQIIETLLTIPLIKKTAMLHYAKSKGELLSKAILTNRTGAALALVKNLGCSLKDTSHFLNRDRSIGEIAVMHVRQSQPQDARKLANAIYKIAEASRMLDMPIKIQGQESTQTLEDILSPYRNPAQKPAGPTTPVTVHTCKMPTAPGIH